MCRTHEFSLLEGEKQLKFINCHINKNLLLPTLISKRAFLKLYNLCIFLKYSCLFSLYYMCVCVCVSVLYSCLIIYAVPFQHFPHSLHLFQSNLVSLMIYIFHSDKSRPLSRVSVYVSGYSVRALVHNSIYDITKCNRQSTA